MYYIIFLLFIANNFTKLKYLKILLKNIIIILLLTLVQDAHSQYFIDWVEGFGGDRLDKANCVVETPDHNLLMVGTVKKKREHIWLLMTDEDGNEMWAKTLEQNYESGANSVIISKDTSFVICGYYVKSWRKNDKQGVITKLDKKGNIKWRKNFGGNGNEEFKDIVQTDDGGYFAVGYTTTGYDEKHGWAVIVDKDGNLENEKIFAESKEDVWNAVTKTTDGNFVVAGYSTFDNIKMFRVTKLTKEGDNVWDLDMNFDVYREANDIVELNDKTLVAVGMQEMKSKDFDAFVMRINEGGNEMWNKTYGLGNWDEATSIVKTADGNFAVSGYEQRKENFYADFWTRKINKQGGVTWQQTFKKRSLDFPNSIIETYDNGLLVAGSTMGEYNDWAFAALKYRDALRTDIKFRNPKTDTITVTKTEFQTELCIRSFDEPKNVQLIVNGILQKDDAYNTNMFSGSDCMYPVFSTLNLQEGINYIKVIVVDKRDRVVTKIRKIFYIPNVNLNW